MYFWNGGGTFHDEENGARPTPSRFKKTQHLSICLPVNQSQIVSKLTWQSLLKALKTPVLCLLSCIIIWQPNVGYCQNIFSNEHGCVAFVNTYKVRDVTCDSGDWSFLASLLASLEGRHHRKVPKNGQMCLVWVLLVNVNHQCDISETNLRKMNLTEHCDNTSKLRTEFCILERWIWLSNRSLLKSINTPPTTSSARHCKNYTNSWKSFGIKNIPFFRTNKSGKEWCSSPGYKNTQKTTKDPLNRQRDVKTIGAEHINIKVISVDTNILSVW